MPRVVPSEVVRTIDEHFYWAKDFQSGKLVAQRSQAVFEAVSRLPGIVAMIEDVPDELLVLTAKDASDFLMARAALQREVQQTGSCGLNSCPPLSALARVALGKPKRQGGAARGQAGSKRAVRSARLRIFSMRARNCSFSPADLGGGGPSSRR